MFMGLLLGRRSFSCLEFAQLRSLGSKLGLETLSEISFASLWKRKGEKVLALKTAFALFSTNIMVKEIFKGKGFGVALNSFCIRLASTFKMFLFLFYFQFFRHSSHIS